MNLWEIRDRKVPAEVVAMLKKWDNKLTDLELVLIRRPNGSTAIYDIRPEEVLKAPFVEGVWGVNEEAFNAAMAVHEVLKMEGRRVSDLDIPSKSRRRILCRLDEADIDTVDQLLAVSIGNKIPGIGEHYIQILRKALIKGGFLKRREVWPRT
jgi:hypothetical protein